MTTERTERTDTERLDWLERQHGCQVTLLGTTENRWHVDAMEGFGYATNLRAAIDAAMDAEGGASDGED